MHPTKNDLTGNIRKSMAALLNARLADALDLQLQTKQAHWNVRGENFIALHELFDALYKEVTDHVDSIAERITALGGTALGTVQAVAKASQLPAYPTNISDGRQHVDKLSSAFAAFGKATRAAIDEADEAGDKNTADLFTGISRAIDKNLWFLEAHLGG